MCFQLWEGVNYLSMETFFSLGTYENKVKSGFNIKTVILEHFWDSRNLKQ